GSANGSTDERIADFALAVHGVDVLREYRDEFTEIGLAPPTRWGGSSAARDFVRSLGFPIEYAGFTRDQNEPLLRVPGPPDLNPLHEFQRRIADNVRGVLTRSRGTRGLLSLPTGAGKTRIAIEAIIGAIRDDGLVGPIVWIAQSEELCEQA